MKIYELSPQPKLLNKVLYWLRLGTYLRNYRTSRELSQRINQLLDNPATEITVLSRCRVQLGELVLWTSNFPYAYGDLIQSEAPLEEKYWGRIPNRQTVFRLRQAVEEAKKGQKFTI